MSIRAIKAYAAIFFINALLFCYSSNAQNTAQLEPHWWQPNGFVHTVMRDGNTVYVGGDFTYVGPSEPYGASVNTTTGMPDFTFLNPNGVVNAAISDGSGGWYIGGAFTQVGGQTRNRLARINSDGSLHAWNPIANGSVNTLNLNGDVVYAGGSFSEIGGQTRNKIVAIDTTTGAPTAWTGPGFIDGSNINTLTRSGGSLYVGGDFSYLGSPEPYGAAINTSNGTPDLTFLNPNGIVNAVIADGSGGWYIGGSFTQVGGQMRNRLARINGDGSLHAWNPDANNTVNTLALNGSTVYVGGLFTSVGGQSRNRIAALETSTGLATTWNPNSNANVNKLAVSGSLVYAGGGFTNVGGQARNRIAAIDTATSLATTWNPNANGAVTALTLNGSTLYVGGNFTSIGGQSRTRIAALNAATGLATSWNPNANSTVSSFAINGSTVYVGGSFTSIGGQTRNNIAALDATTGLATTWNANANAAVTAIALNGSTVYVGGNFTSIGGQTRNYIASLDAATGLASAWNPNANLNGNVRALAVNGSLVYAGGEFTSIGGQTRSRIAALDATTGLVTSWNPNANSTVLSLTFNGSIVYVGGNFTSIGGQTRNYIAALDATTGLATTWNPNANGQVNTVMISGSTVYAGGDFTSIGGQTRNRIAALFATTGLATTWNPNANNTVRTLAQIGSTVYVGGVFSIIGGQSRSCIAAIDATTALATAWNPNSTGSVNVLSVSGSSVFAGGAFSSIGGQSRNRIVALDATTGEATAWNPNADGVVRTLVVSGNTVYVGGEFTNIGGQTRNYIASLDGTTGLATTWNPNSNSTVLTLVLNGSTMYAGGLFINIGGQARSRIAAINATSGLATAWNPGANNDVYAIVVIGSTVYVGGGFSIIGGQARNRIAALDATTGLASSWDPLSDGYVYALAVNGSTVYAGGDFTVIGGQMRNRLAALDITTGGATAWSPDANGGVTEIAVSGSTVYTGGVFTSIGGQTRNRIAALDASSGLVTAWNPNANGNILSLSISGSTVYLGGSFTTIDGQARNYFAAIGQLQNWYLDADNDGYYASTQTSLTSPGVGWTSVLPSGGSGDCDDADASIYTTFSFYADSDGDGFGAGSLVSGICAINNSTPPSGYSMSNTDCEPSDNTKWQNASFYTDVDGDAHYVGLAETICFGATFPVGYVLLADGLGEDCDDNNGSIWRTGDFYVDADSDSYRIGSLQEVCYGASTPMGYVTIGESAGEDCDDSNSLVYQSLAVKTDTDGDGYSVGASQIICFGSTLPGEYVSSAASLGNDCNDADATVWQSGVFYTDNDNDGYHSGSSDICYGSTVPPGLTTTLGNDCDDANTAINPLATEICGDLLDNDCEGGIDEFCSTTFGNDSPAFATNVQYSSNNSYPNCYPILGSLVGSTDSPESADYVGADKWYKFTAQSTAVTISINSPSHDDYIALYQKQGSNYILIAFENSSFGAGDFERLNQGGLTPGSVYYISVGAVSGVIGGSFSLCIQHLMPSGCATIVPAGGLNLCSTYRALYRGAPSQGVTYSFSFTPIGGTGGIATSISGTNGLIVLSNPTIDLRYGGAYNTAVSVTYNLSNSNGTMEPIIVSGNTSGVCSNVSIMPAPQYQVRSAQVCPASLLRSNWLVGDRVSLPLCGAQNFTYEFTQVVGCNDATVVSVFPVEYTTNSAAAYLPLGVLPNLPSTGVWNVRIRPNFAYGSGNYGPMQRIQVLNTSSSSMLSEMATESGSRDATIDLEVFLVHPNPCRGDFVHLVMSDAQMGQLQLRVSDPAGRLVSVHEYSVVDSFNTRLVFDETLCPGVYMIEIVNAGRVQTQRLVVQ